LSHLQKEMRVAGDMALMRTQRIGLEPTIGFGHVPG